VANADHLHHPANGHNVNLHERATPPRTVDDLVAMSPGELAELYASGTTPQLGVLAGETRGRFLAIPALTALDAVPLVGSLVQRAVSHVLASRVNPWRGKTFAAPTESHRTEGTNVVLGRSLFPFEAHVEKSALDHRETLVIRYASKGNPWPLNVLVDELREVSRGVWLGPAYVRGPNGPNVVLWWACSKA
jgi:hypothetical protein